ncbi:hypothetical protein A9264_01375 [Vibrio sp. UCD-FRSSP16_10]|uniref:prepilin-type N-terminal cleavage/methylation domain-containing protein n=1 Tax=unclassified Vibrio TaxID=2614977 RepID=UPI000800EFA4|nr:MULTISPECIES: prepilin-type N-terminal cleavage/methylation domain-containing protein [unclassified Vibrio]OBT17439.1 hypothetical protein A9260_02825 [Vibrio sp. UCD-FRSSP16_30]OBT23208.1 hypothetical protein A9264_01375 [Vibrio sp. UCD-FRSSP16_10]
MNHRSLKYRKGFTLVELIVVIILVAIISIFAVSRFTGGSSYRLPVIQEQTISVIRQIQLGRMQSNVADLDDLSPFYRLMLTQHCLGAQSFCSNPASSDDISAAVFTEDIRFSPLTTLLDFDLLGRPSISPFAITLTDSAGNTAHICIEAEGYIRKGRCS